MYQKQEIDPQKTKKPGRLRTFIRETFSGLHLLRSVGKWGVWAAAVVVIVLVALWNEHSISEKEKRNNRLQEKYDSTVVEFKMRNEVIYKEEEEQLRNKAADGGFVRTKANNYYKIEVPNE